tara:strand:+ start:825 stop:1508 length:684 start_codon:yes stop_codon:yes gene_type:complete
MKVSLKIRKIHRYLGLIIGIQFLIWTISGLYFSWTNLDEIHGDQFMKNPISKISFSGLSGLEYISNISKLELLNIANEPFYWVNEKQLYNAKNGNKLDEITERQAIEVVNFHLKEDLEISTIEKIENIGPHHEYRGKPLPAYAIHFNHPEKITAYVSAKNGKFQRVRHSSWRIFDFLWMGHTMDYNGRDNFNNILLRVFSLFGVLTVLSGFSLWFVTSSLYRKYIRF